MAALNQNISGLVHLTNGVAISKFEMLQLFKKEFNREKLNIEPLDNKKVDKSLKSERSDFNYTVPSYAQMFQKMHENMQENKDVYVKNYSF